MSSSISVTSGKKISSSSYSNNGIKWNTLIHNGVCFPPKYQLKALDFKINGETFLLNGEQEELIYSWAKKKDTHYIDDPIFQRNFLVDLKKLLPGDMASTLTDVGQIDFSKFFVFVDTEKRERGKGKGKVKEFNTRE